MNYADSQYTIRNDRFDLMTNDSLQPTSATPVASRQHAAFSRILPSGFMPPDIYADVRTEHSTTDTAMMNSMDGVAATEPSTTDTVMMDDQLSSKLSQNVRDGSVATTSLTTNTLTIDDQPSSKLSQNIKDDSLTTEASTTTDDELFADFLVDNVDDLVSTVPSILRELPRVPYFQRSTHQQVPTPAVPIHKWQQFVPLITEEMVRWLASQDPPEVKGANDCTLVDPFWLELNRHTQDFFTRFLAKYPYLRSTSQHYMNARHQFWRACGGKAELAPSVGAAELYAWEAAPDSVPAPSPATTAGLRQAREMLSTPPDPRRGRPQIYSFNAENDAARRRTPATNYDAAAAAAAAGMMPPPPPPTRRSDPAAPAAGMMPPPPQPARPGNLASAAVAHIPRPIFGNLDPAILPNSHIDDMRYNLLNTISEARSIVAWALVALDQDAAIEALKVCARLAVLRLDLPVSYLKVTD